MKNISLILLGVLLFSGCGIHIPMPMPSIDFMPRMEMRPPAAQQPQGMQFKTQFELQMFQIVYSYLFSAGGIWPWQSEFEPGEWTKWQMETADNERFETELAYLKSADGARKWWRMSFYPEDGDKIIYEALIDESDYSVRRLRAQTGDNPPREIPVPEDIFISRPVKLTAESIAAATIKTETIKVPAGSFDSRYIKYGIMMGEGTIEIWANDTVPGGVVKYAISCEDDKTSMTSSLKEYGKGAESVLGSF